MEISDQPLKKEENSYAAMRRMALETKAEQPGFSVDSVETMVYGVVMDWNVQNGTASTVAFMDGDAGIFFSSGSGITGGSTHDNVRAKAIEFVSKAQLLLDQTSLADATPLPEDNKVIFYFLTNKGIFSGEENLDDISNQSSIWVDLFLTGNEVITELRKIQGK